MAKDATQTDPSLTDVATQTLEGASAQLVTTANDILKATSEAFPELAGKSFQFYAEYVFAKGVSSVALGVLWILAGIISMLVIPKLYTVWKKACEDYNRDGEQIVTFIAMAALGWASVFGVISGLQGISSGIVPIIAPEGAVINEIVRNIR